MWTVTGTRTDTYAIEWNPSTHTYSHTGVPSKSFNTKSVTGGNQTITITNNSNFNVTPTAAIYAGTEGTTADTLFTATFGTVGQEAVLTPDALTKAGTATLTISPNEDNLKALLTDDGEATIGTKSVAARVHFTFSGATDSLYTYAGNNS